MSNDTSDFLVNIDWDRLPTSEIEEILVSNAFSSLLDFYQKMPSVAQRYAEAAIKSRLCSLVAAIVLNAWDAYLVIHKGEGHIYIENNDEAAALTARHGFQWLDLSNAISGLHASGALAVHHSFALDRPNDPDFLISVGEGLGDNLKTLKAEELDNSQPLDVHTWSDYPEANVFVDHIYDTYFGTGYEDIQKKHIKVLLLDLYVRWTTNPSLKTGFSRYRNTYKTKSRYNSLHISPTTIDIVDRLKQVGLIRQSLGQRAYTSRTGQKRPPRTTRIWPTSKLIMMFEDARFGPLDIYHHVDREVIILRDVDPEDSEKQVEIEYDDDSDTERMRSYVKTYNKLLHRTFIDIPTLEAGFINLSSSLRDKPRRLHVNQYDKFTRRIFNRGSFDKGGRFWGGWWQRCPKEWREKIFIDDKPTSEIDYSGLHIVMLYALEGINYWKTIGSDPYVIELPDFDGTPEQLRDICKQLILVALNAKDDKSTFSAFRNDAETGSHEKGMGNGILSKILDLLKEKHEPIAHMLANDAGIDLMNLDAKITERIIVHFTRRGIPILAIHDSFIVPFGLEKELDNTMQEAFTSVMKIRGSKTKEVSSRPIQVLLSPRHQPPKPPKTDIAKSIETDIENIIFTGRMKAFIKASDFVASTNRKYQERCNPTRTERYLVSLKRFGAWRIEQKE